MKRWLVASGIVAALLLATEITGRLAVHLNAAGSLLSPHASASALVALAWLALRAASLLGVSGLVALAGAAITARVFARLNR